MQLLDLTLDSSAENLALDEALLDTAENLEASAPAEVLRLWEPRESFVVAGNSSRLKDEVNLRACHARRIPVLRRASGGATILAGPGCLMYAVVLGYRDRSHLRDISQAHRFVLDTVAAALSRKIACPSGSEKSDDPQPPVPRGQQPAIRRAGISDLVLGEPPLKFSGNSLRCKRDHFLYHGTVLYDFSLDEIEALLNIPSRQPAYRQARSHQNFLTNLPLRGASVRQALIDAFNAHDSRSDWPRELTAKLAERKYARPEWNERL